MHRLLPSLILVAACGNKPGPPVDPGPASGSAAASTADAAPGSGSAPAPTANRREPVTLPKPTDTPPKPTTGRLDRAAFDRVGALEYPSFDKRIEGVDDKGIQVKFQTKERPKMAVTVNVAPCFDCLKMDLAAWREKTAALKLAITPALREHKNTKFAIDEYKLNGATVIGTYQLGSNLGEKDDEGNTTGSYMNAFTLYYNDGNNQARVMVSYADDPLAGLAAMTRVMPREDLELVAMRFLGAITHTW
ncbi:MAG: hypothetical protein KIT31_12695 [Deltaproteobacteria bacterium]|nr:hypothetical protein [Deltaproteobacteria bacterium]